MSMEVGPYCEVIGREIFGLRCRDFPKGKGLCSWLNPSLSHRTKKKEEEGTLYDPVVR